MVPLNAKQQADLRNPTRKAILNFLNGYDKPASLGEIGEGIELPDLAIVFFHLSRLVEVDLVEKVPGTERFRVVEP
jgi:predicted ArsR family transcriptional regulator